MMEVAELRGAVYVQSERTQGQFYAVDLDAGTCSCPAATFRPGRSCKHVKRASAWALATAAVRGKVAA